MSDLIEAVKKTRELAADIFTKSLINLEGNSEIEIREKILSEVKNHSEIFTEGWYDPPPFGVAVLLDKKPYERLLFKSLRNSECWPNEISKFDKETVGMVYFSPVDCKTKMLGDIGLTIYRGNDQEIKEYIKKCYKSILSVAEHAKVGMKFSDLCIFADKLLKNKYKIVGWMTASPKSQKLMNFGHTIPGSFENNFVFGNAFEEIKESIRTKRLFINEIDNFEITKTCAFTVETRLLDPEKLYLPVVYFHFIVCFNKGKKEVLENFSEIFKTVGMDYMNSK